MPDSTSTTPPSPPTSPAPQLGGSPLAEAQRKQAFVAGLQRDLNRFLSTLGAPTRLAVDGEWDDHTEAAFQQVCRILGLAPERNVRTFRLIAGGAAEPTAEELQRRATEGAAFAADLRAKFAQARETGKAAALGGTPLAPEQAKQAYIAALQRDLNTHMRRLHTGIELAIDGQWDEHTDLAFKQVCKVLGIEPEIKARTFRIIAGAAAARTSGELARAHKQGEAFAGKLKENGVPPRIVLGGRSLPKDERQAAYVAFVQRTLNDHLVRLGSPAVLAVDGKWGKETQRAFTQVCKVLGLKPERSMRVYRILAGALAPRAADETQRASTAGAAFEQQLRAAFVHQRERLPRHEKPREHRHETPAEPGGDDARLAAAIRAHGGRYEAEILAASRKTGVPVALLCAMIEHESGFTNVFGHDTTTRNPVKSIFGRPNLVVTKEKYLEYRAFRRKGLGVQGVGPMQLTTGSFQDRADALGGAWIPANNIQIGAEVILEKIKVGGGTLRGGLRAYNGSGPAAERYADTMMKNLARWQGFLGTSAAASGRRGAVAATSRTFRASSNPPVRADVKSFQRLINRRFAAWRVHKVIEEDGRFGVDTRDAAREVATGMGIARVDFAHGFTPQVRRVMAHPKLRTPAQQERAARRAPYRTKLRKRYARATVLRASAASLLHGRPAPRSAALMKIIQEAAGFGLVVTSTTGGKHAPTSFHFQGLAVDFGVTADLVGTPEHTKRLKAFQKHMLAQAPHLLELFGPIQSEGVKNGSQITIPRKLWLAHLDHVHVAAK